VEAWRAAVQHQSGPVALVCTRQKVPVIDRARYAPANGLRLGAYVLADAPGGRPAVILMASGSEVELVLGAYETLAAAGIAARAVSRAVTSRGSADSGAVPRGPLPAGRAPAAPLPSPTSRTPTPPRRRTPRRRCRAAQGVPIAPARGPRARRGPACNAAGRGASGTRGTRAAGPTGRAHLPARDARAPRGRRPLARETRAAVRIP